MLICWNGRQDSFRNYCSKECAGSNPAMSTKIKINKMSKLDKKKLKLQERINFLEKDMKDELTKKVSNTSEINLPARLNEIKELKEKLQNIK